MKISRVFKSTILILLVLCIILSAFACGDSETESQQPQKDTTASDTSDTIDETQDTVENTDEITDTDTQTESEEITESSKPTETETDKPDVTISGTIFTLFANGEYNCPIIKADKANAIENDFYNKFRAKLKEITGVNTKYATDFISYNADPAEREHSAILIGSTNYDESQEVYKTLTYGESKIKLIGNKLVITFTNQADADAIYEDLLNLLKTATKTKIQFSTSRLPIENSPNSVLSTFPALPGTTATYVDCGDDTHMIRIPEVDLDDFAAYKQLLVNNGYKLTNSRTAGKNSFATYVKGNTYMYIYHKDYSQSIRAITGNTKHLPDYNAERTVTKVAEPTVTLLGQSNSRIGLGILYRLPDGRFVVFDGGDNYNKDIVYNAMKAQSVDGSIKVAAWFLSHAHGDHHDAFMEFVNKHGNITIENIVFNYASKQAYLNMTKTDENTSNDSMTTVRNFISSKLPNAKIIKAHAGQIFYFGGCPFEILYTHEDFAPTNFEYLNDSSLIVRATVSGKKILMLADATYTIGAVLVSTYGEYLKSDMVQLAHHGQYASYYRVYDYAKADVLFWPSNSSSAKEQIVNVDEAVIAALSHATDVYLPGPNNITINFPYTFKNNKADFVANHS